ncbi:MAG: capsule biosynthesis protein [Proteobacteria bacterium]|nr:capsule biosynthesis protein [Pseudomonadota bacterium]MBS0572582.1 capsule biosynthesis protein [Pseudomonadota bacterium]
MNMPPSATRFRVRKIVVPSKAATPAGQDMPFAPAPEDDGFGDLNLVAGAGGGDAAAASATATVEPPAASAPGAEAGPKAALDPAAELEAVRREPLTARNLRTARRVALAHGIEAGSDHEAVMLLRRKGIDPFVRTSIRDLMREELPLPPRPDLPARVAPGQMPKKAPDPDRNLPAPNVASEAERVRAIMAMQRDIVRRRQRNFMLLLARLAFFVFFPTFLAGAYYAKYATPLFSTVSSFQVQQADPMGGLSSIGSMFRGTQFATSKDDIAVQAYLQSRDAMQKLDETLGFKKHFSQPSIDPLQRLAPDATDEDAYKLYRRNVKIAYDPTEGLIKMEVLAADPQVSEAFSRQLISLAEDQVNRLTERVREDQMKGARASYQDAEAKMQAAQQKVLDLQKKQGILDPKVETQIIMTEVAELEKTIRVKQLELDQLNSNPKPNKARVDGVTGDIARLNAQLGDLRRQMTEGSASEESMAQVTGELRFAETELQTRQQMLAAALQQVETARIEANRQVRYLATSVAPVAEDMPAYPRVFEDTALAFLIFAGIYLMLSLTASILREQVTS